MLTRFFRALARLHTNTDALADTLGEANRKLRDQLGLDAPPDRPALPSAAADPFANVEPFVAEAAQPARRPARTR